MLSDALLQLYAHCSAKDFPQRVVQSLHLLFPEGSVAIDEVFKQSGEVVHCFQDTPLHTRDVWTAWEMFSHQHPGIRYVADGGRDRLLCLSDMIPYAQLRNLDLYQHVFVPVDVRDEITFIVPGSAASILGITICLSKTASFEQRALAESLFPHLEQAQRNAACVASGQLFPLSERELRFEIPMARGGPIGDWPPGARRLVDLFFDRRSNVPWQPPPDLLAWIKSRRESLRDFGDWRRLSPLVLTNKRGKLHVNFSLHVDSQGEVLFLSGRIKNSGLGEGRTQTTAREREVISWVSAGKSNAEIAAILGMSLATVKKHLENIFQKVGVENRMALSVWAHKARQEGSDASSAREAE
jgi:DNA-binding CsgD family transcriptional regulator